MKNYTEGNLKDLEKVNYLDIISTAITLFSLEDKQKFLGIF